MTRDQGIPKRKPQQKPYLRQNGRPVEPLPVGKETPSPVPNTPNPVGKRSSPLNSQLNSPVATPPPPPPPSSQAAIAANRASRRGALRWHQRVFKRLYRLIHRLILGTFRFLVRLFTNWKFIVSMAFVTTLGAAALAMAYIFQLPGLPNCPAVFWPLASASMRFECARIAASKETAKDLLEAIALVDSLPPDHAMRTEANRLVELWSQEVLKLAEQSFQQGKLEEAIAAAQQIPAKVTAHKLVEDRIKRWQTIWAKAETAYRKAESALRQRNWKLAFEHAVDLLNIDNRYWQTTRYDELNNRINVTREDGNKLYKAEWLADQGGLNNLQQAVKLAKEIRRESYVYDLAQTKIQGFGRKMMELAQASLQRHNLQDALAILDKIPDEAKLEQEVKDLSILANAESQSWQDSVPGLEAAIVQAQRIRPGRPLYPKAQHQIARWQYEIEGLAQIERARSLAQEGNPQSYVAAITAASQVSASNPRYGQAQKQIQQWRAEIQTLEDQPVLDQADQFASSGEIAGLQAAVAQANQIAQGRSLYSSAQARVRKWTRDIQRTQDQPLLDQARSYAFAGNLSAAISTAEQIRPGRALYDDAQADLAKWRGQIQAQVAQVQAQNAQAQAQRNLQEARQAASVGNPAAIANAIRIATQVPTSGSVQTEIDTAVNEWSWQLLTIAKEQAYLNPAAAIAIVQRIPPRAEAYAEAQAQIAAWKKQPNLR